MARWAFIAALAFAQASELHDQASSQVAKNPIRKVVTMLSKMKEQVEMEGKKEEELYEKYMCYCKTSGGDLQGSIAAAEAKGTELVSTTEEAAASKKQLDADLVQHKADREAAIKALLEATALREKEAAAYAKFKAEGGTNVDALLKAVDALEKGVAGSFLQTTSAGVLRQLAQSNLDMVDADREDLMAFLQSSDKSEYAPQSGQIIGILKQLGDEMVAGLSEATANEKLAIKQFEELTAAKEKEKISLTKSIADKSVRVGELAVSIAQMKNEAEDTAESLAEDKAFLADLEKNCATKSSEWDEIVKTRSEELVALAETIKILNDDDALELFKKALPSSASSLVQVTVSKAFVRQRAFALVRAAQQANKPARQQLDFIALALHGKSIGFEKIITMIDELTALLKKEQSEDDAKKEYCAAELDATDDTKKGLEQSISDSDKAIADAEETIATFESEIKALQDGIKALDKAVAEATEQRKEENNDFKELMAQDSAATELLGFAKNRLNKFYNPKMYVPPPKRDLSAEDTIVVSMGGTAPPTPAPGGIAGTGVAVLVQVSAHTQNEDAPAPPPESFGAYAKKEDTGVIAMMDLLIKDLKKEMQTAEADEKNAQADYEQAMSDSAEKRAMDTKLMKEKVAAKADAEGALETHKSDNKSTAQELTATLKTIQGLHSECDWLVQYFDARKEARAAEIDSLANAKAVLSGADYALMQTRARRLRGPM